MRVGKEILIVVRDDRRHPYSVSARNKILYIFLVPFSAIDQIFSCGDPGCSC